MAGGIAGFPKRDESPYDAFGTGHSSTSISAALGMAVAAQLENSERRAGAIIGDGALTGGMAFERSTMPARAMPICWSSSTITICPFRGRSAR